MNTYETAHEAGWRDVRLKRPLHLHLARDGVNVELREAHGLGFLVTASDKYASIRLVEPTFEAALARADEAIAFIARSGARRVMDCCTLEIAAIRDGNYIKA